jgi:hypothetical protein
MKERKICVCSFSMPFTARTMLPSGPLSARPGPHT